MKKMRYVSLMLSAALTLTMLTACSGSTTTDTTDTSTESSSGEVCEIEIVTNQSDPVFSALDKIFDKYMEENPGVVIQYSTQEADYEQLMKARMASNDLPDIFVTHGWSVARYSEYLRPLNDQPWYDEILPSFLPIISNDDNEIFVMPINMDTAGILYNKGLLEELGVDVPTTWEEFYEICELGKEAGYTGVFIAGKDSRQPATLLDIAASTIIDNRNEGYTQQLLDDTFEWANWEPVSELLKSFADNGYLNADAATCDPVDIPVRLAENNVLFHFTLSTELIQQVQEVNPDVVFGLAPIPAFDESYEPVFCSGEREAYGVWKDTQYEEECLDILEYLAQPENVKAVCEASGRLPAIQNVEADLGSMMDDFNTYAETAAVPIFDRVYLPSGMWSTMQTIGSALVSEGMSVEESAKVMESDYNTLKTQ